MNVICIYTVLQESFFGPVRENIFNYNQNMFIKRLKKYNYVSWFLTEWVDAFRSVGENISERTASSAVSKEDVLPYR